MNNPWEKITFGAQRRIETNSAHNFFWIADAYGRYGLFIQIAALLPSTDYFLKLKGISIISRNSPNGHGELILILNNNRDWELFLKICVDLVAVSEKCVGEENMVNTVYGRLKKWQAFLRQNTYSSLTLNEQMGLVTELLFLAECIFPNNSSAQAIASWTGADFDKQDFSLENKMIEVKSYISSKGPNITVSSLHQLDNSNKPLFLAVYGLTISERGFSVPETVELVEQLIKNDANLLENFQEKLALRGYIVGVTEPPFYGFHVDRLTAYAVVDKFPRITAHDVREEIVSVKYTIDTNRCSQFETKLTLIFEN
jgi:hypothetical protein